MNSVKKVLLILADGFEETEALGSADVLKRLGVTVTLAGLESAVVRSSANTKIVADCLLEEVSLDDFAGLVLPGGLPGSTNLRDSEKVITLVRKMYESQRVVAAICAAPIVLERAGITANRTVTGYPSTNEGLADLVYTGERTERDGNLVTGKGPGVTFEFAFRVAEALGISGEKINAVANGMFVKR